MLDFCLDVESDLHRFHGVLVDLENDDYGGLDARRLFSWIERLTAYDGALSARVMALQEEAKRHNPSQKALSRPDTTVSDSVADLAMGGLVEYETA